MIHDSLIYGLFHVMSSHFIGSVSLYFVVGKILAFLCTSLMLCENKIRHQFPITGTVYCSFHLRAAIFESFGFGLRRSVFNFEGRALYTLRPHITHPTDNFPLPERAEFTTQQMLSN